MENNDTRVMIERGQAYLDSELAHYGTKGMKWGRRLYQNKDGSLTALGKKRYNKEFERLKEEEKVLNRKARTQSKINKLEDMRKANEAKRTSLEKTSGKKQDEPDQPKKKIKEMSDSELKQLKERLQLEKDYKSLVNETRNEKVAKGKKFIGEVLEQSGKNLVTQVVNHFGAKGLNALISKIDGSESPVIFANNKKK